MKDGTFSQCYVVAQWKHNFPQIRQKKVTSFHLLVKYLKITSIKKLQNELKFNSWYNLTFKTL